MMKNVLKILILALPFAWFASISLPFLNGLGVGVTLVDVLSIKGYWAVTLIFYFEEFISALLVTTPYAALVLLLVKRNTALVTATAIVGYALFTFLLCFQKEHLTPCLFTLVQSANVSVYAAIFVLLSVFDKVFSQQD